MKTTEQAKDSTVAIVPETEPSQTAKDKVEQVSEAVRSRPRTWSAAGVGVLAAAAGATFAALAWRRRQQRRPKARAARAWSSVTDRFHR